MECKCKNKKVEDDCMLGVCNECGGTFGVWGKLFA